MKTAVIIQARMGSTRLPGKSLLLLAGIPAIRRVVDRSRMIEGVNSVLVATTVSSKDDALADYCTANCIPVFRGSEEDVLDRYFNAAKTLAADIVIRITGDCPFIDPVESAKVLRAFLADPTCDYMSNIEPPFLPDGMDTEVFCMSALEKAWRTANDLASREHVTWFIRTHKDDFVVRSITEKPDRSAYRLTLDEAADFEVLSAIADELSRRNLFGHVDEIIRLLSENPDLGRANAGIERNEGLKNTLEKQRSAEAKL